MEVITTRLLVKTFGTTCATDHLSIRVQQGEIYGFLGLNGAGKTTLIRILLGMIKPDSGSVKLFGQDLFRGFTQWNQVGYLVETPHAYPELSVRENLKVIYELRQLRDSALIDRIIDQLKLSRYQHEKAKVLSLGNRQRLGLAKALMHQPALLLLDEPINGLDPEGIVEVRELLRALSVSGTTIFLSSHLLGEVAKLAHRIGIIHRGRLVKEVTNQDLSSQLRKKVIVQTADNAKALQYLRSVAYQASLTPENEIEVVDPEAIGYPEEIARKLVHAGLPPGKLFLLAEDLETYFLRSIQE